MASSSSRQHPHLPPHAAATSASALPALPIESNDAPNDDAYTMSQNLGGSRTGSADPLVHAAAAAAAANPSSDGHHHHHHGSSSPFGVTSPGSRKRSAGAAMLDAAASAGQGGNGGPDSPPRYNEADPANMAHESERSAQLNSLSGYGLNWEDAAAAAAAAAAAGEAENGQAASAQGDQPYYGQYTQHDAAAQGAGSSSNATGTTSNTGSNKRRSTRGAAAAATSTDSNNGGTSTETKSSLPYARSPELRVSHKLAERKRRKEMKDLFDGLKKNLPDPETTRGEGSAATGNESAKDRAKLSKWEVLSRATNHINWLEACKSKLLEEVERLRSQSGLPLPFELPAYPQAEPVSAGLGGEDDVSKDAQMEEGHEEHHHHGHHDEHQHHQLHSEHEQHHQHHEHEHAPHHGDGGEVKHGDDAAVQAETAGSEIQAAMNMFSTAAAQQQQQQQQQ